MLPLRRTVGISIIILLHVTVVLSSVGLYLLWNNNLKSNGNWRVSKTELEVPGMGSISYFRNSQALARCHLNLGAWHGFQEVIYKRPVKIRSLGFRFLLGPNSYLNLIYFRDGQEFRGFRFSVNAMLSNVAFAATNEGGFLRKTPISLDFLNVGRWHRCHLQVEGQKPVLKIDGQRVDLGEMAPLSFTTLGFRGCENMVLVDDITVTEEDGAVIHETFFCTRHWLLATLVALGIVIAADALLLLAMRRAKFSPPHMAFGTVYVGAIAAMTLVAAFGFTFLTQHKYPTEGSIPQAQAQEARQYDEACLRENLKRVTAAPGPGVVRLVFLGTSQTHGGSSTKSSQAFVPRVSQRLNDTAPPGIRYECINAGVSGGDSALLAKLYKELLLPLHPDSLVINLATNDQSGPLLAASLNRIIDMSEEHHVKVMLMLEPNTIERWPDDMPNHPIMRQVANERHIPCVELHQYIKYRCNTGFVWWDFVHPTSYGHQLIADCVLDALKKHGFLMSASRG